MRRKTQSNQVVYPDGPSRKQLEKLAISTMDDGPFKRLLSSWNELERREKLITSAARKGYDVLQAGHGKLRLLAIDKAFEYWRRDMKLLKQQDKSYANAVAALNEALPGGGVDLFIAPLKQIGEHLRNQHEFLLTQRTLMMAAKREIAFLGRKQGAYQSDTIWIVKLLKMHPDESTAELYRTLRSVARDPLNRRNPTPGECPFSFKTPNLVMKGGKEYPFGTFRNMISTLRRLIAKGEFSEIMAPPLPAAHPVEQSKKGHASDGDS